MESIGPTKRLSKSLFTPLMLNCTILPLIVPDLTLEKHLHCNVVPSHPKPQLGEQEGQAGEYPLRMGAGGWDNRF